MIPTQSGGYRLNRDETISLFEFPASQASLRERLMTETASMKTKRKKTRKSRLKKKRKTRRK